MASVLDAAAYILKKCGRMSAMKLHKLLYYSQAWSLVWDEKPLFSSKIEAWANGPVVPRIYVIHRGSFQVTSQTIEGDASALSKDQKETVDAVLEFYGDKSSQWLSDQTHSEAPWRDARAGLSPGDRGNNEITLSAMAEYYGSL
jgi:uncharacterized phage-associated protein